MAYLLGFILGIFYIKFLNSKHKLDLSNDLINDFFFYTILGVILGGRIGYITLYNPIYYFSNPLEIIKVWKGGMAFHGGLIGVFFAVIVFSKKKIFQFINLKVSDGANKLKFLHICRIIQKKFMKLQLIMMLENT